MTWNVRIAGVLNIAALSVLLLSGCGAAVSCVAQDGIPVASSPGSPYTLHVYEDLMQVPALVLNTLHGSYYGLGTNDFSIRLDSGPAFHPAHLRVEGDDPLNVALLVDDSDPQTGILSTSLEAAVAQLPPRLFGPGDRLSVFAFDCTLVRSAFATIGSIPLLQSEVHTALHGARLHTGTKQSGRCDKYFGLWDAIGEVAREMRDLPGRQVVLVLSKGSDRGSRNAWETVRRYANTYSITIFGLRPPAQPVDFAGKGTHTVSHMEIDSEDRLSLLCGGTGGLSLTSSPQTLEPMIRQIVGLLRSRYILEFPRPANATTGFHDIAVGVNDKTALVRVSGVTVPLPDKLLLKDPSTVPKDATRSPMLGTREILTQKKQ